MAENQTSNSPASDQTPVTTGETHTDAQQTTQQPADDGGSPAEKTVSETTKPTEGDGDKAEGGGESLLGEPKKDEPINYELKLPENAVLPEELVDGAVAFAKEHKLPAELAQQILDHTNSQVDAFVKGQTEQFKKMGAEWFEAVKKDPVYGRSNFEESKQLARKAWDEFAPEDLKKDIAGTEWENHPGLFKLLVEVGKRQQNDTFVQSNASTPKKQLTAAELFYGTAAQE